MEENRFENVAKENLENIADIGANVMKSAVESGFKPEKVVDMASGAVPKSSDRYLTSKLSMKTVFGVAGTTLLVGFGLSELLHVAKEKWDKRKARKGRRNNRNYKDRYEEEGYYDEPEEEYEDGEYTEWDPAPEEVDEDEELENDEEPEKKSKKS